MNDSIVQDNLKSHPAILHFRNTKVKISLQKKKGKDCLVMLQMCLFRLFL